MKNKRMIAALLSAALITTSLATMQVSALFKSPATFDENDVVLKTGVMTDIHVNVDNTNNDERIKKTTNFFKTLAGGENELDAITISGDITDWKPNEDIKKTNTIFKSCLDGSKTELVITMGNHDVYNSQGNGDKFNFFRDQMGDFTYKNPVSENTQEEITKGNYHTIIGGVHFIAVYGIDGDHTQDNLRWLDKHLDIATKANPNMPVFVITHVIPANTVYGSEPNPRWSSSTIGATLAKYPQSIVIAGHSHNTVVPETALWQESYTAIHAGVISSSNPTAGFIEVDGKGVVRYSRYFINSGTTQPQQIRESWVFPTMKKASDATYTNANRVSGKKAPYFEDNRKNMEVQMTQVFNTGTVSATFDTAKDEDMVYAYTLRVREKATGLPVGETSATTNFTNYYNPATQMPNGKQQLSFSFSGLKSETTYEVCAFALDSFGTFSQPLIWEYTTNKFADIPTDDFNFKPIVNFDFCKDGEEFATSENDKFIKFDKNYNKKALISAVSDGANSGKALAFKSIKNMNYEQNLLINTTYEKNTVYPVDAKDPKFFSFYIDATNYKTSSSSTEAFNSIIVKFTETGLDKSNKTTGDVTYKIKNNGAVIMINENGYKNANASSKGTGALNISNRFKGYIMVPISSFEVESGTDTNGKIDAKDVKAVSFNFGSLGYKNSFYIVDDIGFAVPKTEENSIPYTSLKKKFAVGDANLDGKFDTRDSLCVLKYVAGMIKLTEDQTLAADYYQDQKVDTRDSLKMLKSIAGIG